MLRLRIIKSSLLIAIGAVIVFSLYTIYFVYPSFTGLLLTNTEHEAVRVAKHLAAMFLPENEELTSDSIPEDLRRQVSQLGDDFTFVKLKIFSPSGEIIFSTDEKDVGTINQKTYFKETVARGHTYTKVVRKGTRTLEGQIMDAEVVETYVPLMKDNRFFGAFEIYYDITAQKGDLHSLVSRTNVTVLILGLGLLVIAFVSSLQAIRAIRERDSAEDELRRSEEMYSKLFHRSNDGIFMHDLEGNIIEVNNKVLNQLGYSRDELMSLKISDLHPTGEDELSRYAFNKISQDGFVRFEINFVRKNGEVFPAEVSSSSFELGDKKVVQGIVREITERKHAEEKLRKSEEKFRDLFENANDLIQCVKPDGTFLYVNPAWKETLGYGDDEAAELSVFDIIHPDSLEHCRAMFHQLMEGEEIGRVETKFIAKDGKEIIVEGSVDCDLIEGKSVATRGIFRDITERKRIEEQLRHDALHDVLTGIPNRTLFMDRLRQANTRLQRRADANFAVLFLDIDRFKVVNDSLGHIIGDQLLIGISRRLNKCLRPSDTVARLGGDEFGILIEDVKNYSDAKLVADRVQERLRKHFILHGEEVFITTSIGIALSSPEYEKPEHVLRDADIAMYYAKSNGKARYEIFDTKMHDSALKRLQMETELRQGLERKEFLLHYQPVISLGFGRIIGFEALVRWESPKRGLVSPLEFIPVAEETGLIIPLGQWVLEESCRQIHVWQGQFHANPPLTISVNISGKEFSLQLVEHVEKVLRETGLEGNTLRLEITETTIMENTKTAASVLKKLKALGVQLHIDDFGTGYSSLSYLRHFPIDALKVDRSFVSKMCDDEDNFEIVRAVISLAHNLGMTVIAEGVETIEQLKHFEELRCEYLQGYLFSKPMTSENAEAFLTAKQTSDLTTSLEIS